MVAYGVFSKSFTVMIIDVVFGIGENLFVCFKPTQKWFEFGISVSHEVSMISRLGSVSNNIVSLADPTLSFTTLCIFL